VRVNGSLRIRDNFELGAEARSSSLAAGQPLGHLAAQASLSELEALRLVWHAALSRFHHCQRELRFAPAVDSDGRPDIRLNAPNIWPSLMTIVVVPGEYK